MTELIFILVLNAALWPVFRYIGKKQVRRAKLMRLQETAAEWQHKHGGYCAPMSFYWHGSNPVLLWRRLSDGAEFPLEIE